MVCPLPMGKVKNRKALAWALGRSIAKQSEGGAGEKAARRERVNLITKERKSSVPYWEPQLSFL